MKQILIIAGLAVCLGACSEKKEQASNPFLTEFTTPYGVPPFDKIQLEHYKPAFLLGMEEQKKEIEEIINQKAAPNFENTIAALDRSGELLDKVSSVFFNQNSAHTSDAMQALTKELSPLLSKHGDDINLNPRLFARVKVVYEKRAELKLNKEQAKLLEETYKNFVRGGANLNPDDQARLRKLNSELSMLQLSFGQNMLKETNAYKLIIDKKEDLAGLSESLIKAAAETAKNEGLQGKWVFTLHNPSVMPFLQYADNRELRKQILNAYLNRGNNNNDADNKEIVKQLMTLRLEKAKVLGFENYAAFALEERMAKSADNVYNLLNAVWKPALVKAKAEAADLQAAMKKEGVKGKLEAWDWRYYNEKVKKARFNFDENLVRPYLKMENVREGMFYVANQLYGITFTELTNVPKPHPEAIAFECRDTDGTHLGVLYFDFFPRASKRGGAWCTSYRPQSYKDGKRVAPVISVVCNFTKPVGNAPALLSVDETETMFHEFGHALHGLFKDVRYAGTSGVPRDFVELPSQVMEHWATEPQVLNVYAKHYETGEIIPAELIEVLEKSGKYGQGFATAEYLEASLLDMNFHVLTQVDADFDVLKFESDAMTRLGALSQIPPRYRTTYFNHIMGSGYSAGYYSYMWSEVLDADAFEAFVETGNIFDQETAKRFRKYVLTPGGIDDADVMYRNFRGKDASTDALLRNRGLK